MSRDVIAATLRRIAETYVGRQVGDGEAIYQEAGLNGADFYEFMREVTDTLAVPEFDWGAFADMSEPPEGMGLLGRFRILPRKRLTVAHLADVISCGRWFEPSDA